MTRRQRLYFATMMLALVIPAAGAMDGTNAITITTAGASEAASVGGSDVPASCPVTLPSYPEFIPPGPYPPTPPGRGMFWHGTSGLWTMLGRDGMYRGIASPSPGQPHAIATRNKVFWWSPGFHPIGTPSPPLRIEGRRIDGEAPMLVQPWVTNAHAPEFGGWTMLIMLELPTLGCWEVTGSYYGDSVTFVVWVTPPYGR